MAGATAEKLYYLSCKRFGAFDDNVVCIGYRNSEPTFWECFDIARDHGCEWFALYDGDGYPVWGPRFM